MTLLHHLPEDHPDRNRPLDGCYYRWKESKAWKQIRPSMKIAKVTYNQLGNAWVLYDEFSWDTN